MSATTTAPLLLTPTSSEGLNPTCNASWAYGSWVEAIASAAANTVIAGYYFFDSVSAGWWELEIGIGSAGNEVTIARFRHYTFNVASVQPVFLPVPVAGISTGDRIAIRLRSEVTRGNTRISLLYHEDYDGPSLTEPAATQLGAAGASISVNTTAWANSSYAELTPGLVDPILVYGIAVKTPSGEDTTQYEFDVASGAASSETVIFTATITRRTASGNGGYLSYFHLPRPVPLFADTRVSIRVRKSGTNGTAIEASLL